jgi:hypothetical protein
MTATLNQIWCVGAISQPDMAEEGLGRLLIEYQHSPRFKAFLQAVLEEVASIDRVTLQYLAGIWPATAIGVQLDLVGKIVGQERGEFEDEKYRILILGRIFVNRANGKLPAFLELLVDILGLVEPVVMREYYPAALRISITAVPYPEPVLQLLADMGAGGVLLDVDYSEESQVNLFTTSTNYILYNIDVNRGTANHDETTGGLLVGMRRS